MWMNACAGSAARWRKPQQECQEAQKTAQGSAAGIIRRSTGMQNLFDAIGRLSHSNIHRIDPTV